MSRVRTATSAACLVATALVFAASPSTAGIGFCGGVEDSALAEPPGSTRCLPGGNPLDRPALPQRGVVGDYPSWLLNFRSTPDQILTAPVGTMDTTVVADVADGLVFFALDFDNSATTLWAIEDNTRELGTLDPDTGVWTPHGPVTGIPTGHRPTGMSIDPRADDRVFVVTGDTTMSQLHRLDLETRALTLVGTLAGVTLAIDLGVSNDGTVYVHDISSDSIFAADPDTAETTLLGPTGYSANFAQGMDFDPWTNTLYAWLYQGSGVNHLGVIDLETGEAKLIADGNNTELEGAIRVPSPWIFVDGFETEDTSRWSAANP